MERKMTFPETWEEFEKKYGFDCGNGEHLIPTFRVEQWLKHLEEQENEKREDFDFLLTCTKSHIENLIANLEELYQELETPIPTRPEGSE